MKKLLVGLTVLLLHTAAAHAQQILPEPVPPPPPPPAAAPAPAPQAQPVQELPPAYAPPPGYVPPPAPPVYGPPPAYGAPPAYAPRTYGPPPYQPSYRYAPYRYAPPPYYTYPPPPPPRDVLNRPFTLGGGIGFGGLIFENPSSGKQDRENGFAYTFRLGFGLQPGLLLLWDVEGAVANSGSSTIAQTANLLALQIFLTHRLFIKGGFGLADAAQDNQPTQWGAAAMGGLGYELIQGWNWSFDIEATITGAHLNSNGNDQTVSNWSLVNFALNFF
jgi:hypothetical protein